MLKTLAQLADLPKGQILYIPPYDINRVHIYGVQRKNAKTKPNKPNLSRKQNSIAHAENKERGKGNYFN